MRGHCKSRRNEFPGASDDARIRIVDRPQSFLTSQRQDAELLLWKHLRDRRFDGLKFRRQHPCGPFILDERRTAFVVHQGIVVLRFPTDLVFRELTAVLESIGAVLRDDPSP